MPKNFPSLLATVLFSLSAVCHATPGVTADSILIGQSAALTGPFTEFGSEMRNGALAYFDDVNANGGVNGRKIILKTMDDAYDPNHAVANTKALMEQDKVFALFGYVGSVTSVAVLPLLSKSDIPFFGAHTGADEMRHPFNPNVFNVIAGYSAEVEKIVENLDALGVKTIAVLYQNDPYGRAGLESVERALKKRHLEVHAVAMVERDSVDVGSAVAKMRSVHPRAIIIAAGNKPSAAFILGMTKDAESIPYFWNLSSVGSQTLSKDLGPAGRGVMISKVIPAPWDERLAVVKEYHRLYPKPGRRISYTSLQGFLAAKAFVEGLRRAGKDLTRASFSHGLETMHAYDLGGFVVKYSSSEHAGSDFVDLSVIGAGGAITY